MHHLLEIDSIINNFGTRQLLTDVYLKINTVMLLDCSAGTVRENPC